MKKIGFLLVLCFIAMIIVSAGEYRKYSGTLHTIVVTDSGGDSTFLAKTGQGIGLVYGFDNLHADIKLNNASPNPAGLGNSDSGWLWLYTKMASGDLILVDSAVSAGLPCSLNTVIHSNVGDSLLREELLVYYQIYDSLGDTLATVNYPITYNVILK